MSLYSVDDVIKLLRHRHSANPWCWLDSVCDALHFHWVCDRHDDYVIRKGLWS